VYEAAAAGALAADMSCVPCPVAILGWAAPASPIGRSPPAVSVVGTGSAGASAAAGFAGCADVSGGSGRAVQAARIANAAKQNAERCLMISISKQ
jgi:hypothetical protein